MSIAFVVPVYRVDSEMAGIGVRVWELAQALAQHMPVTIVARRPSDFHAEGVKVVSAADESWPEAVLQCDAAVFYDLPDTRMMLAMHRAGKLVISDNAVSIEHLEYDRIRRCDTPDAAYEELISRFRLQLLISDHFIVRSHVARSTLIAGLSLTGRLSYINYNRSPCLNHLLSFIPIGFNKQSSEHAKSMSASLPMVDLTWNGGIWDFYNPVAVVEAIGLLNRAGTPVKIRFMYMPPSDQTLHEGTRLRDAVCEHGLEDLVEFVCEPLSHYRRDGVIKSSRAAICIGKNGIENFTSIRLRVRDSFLYRMPILVDHYGATADFVRECGIGLTCDPENIEDLANALARISFDADCYDKMVQKIESIRPDFEIDRPALKLVEFVGRKRRAPDIGTIKHDALVADSLIRFPFLEESTRYPF